MISPKNSSTIALFIIMGLFLFGVMIAACSPVSPELQPAKVTPTAVDMSPLTLGDFSAALKGKGVHGGMICITYAGDPQDLEQISLRALTIRQGKYLDISVPLEDVNGEPCFEITDAKYLSVSSNAQGGNLIIPEDPITVKIIATSDLGRELHNDTQEIDIGKYVQYPFLDWIYPEGVIPGCVADSHYREDPYTNQRSFYPAWDIIPEPSESYPTIVGTPVLAPVDGIFYAYNIPSEDDALPFGFNAIMIYSQDTGYLVNLTHEYDLVPWDGKWTMLEDLTGKEVGAGEQVGIIGPKDWGSGIPHTHVQVTIAWVELDQETSTETIYRYLTNISHPNIDFLKEELFIDDEISEKLNNPTGDLATCQGYPWGEVVIPQELPFSIDGKSSDWSDYRPVLTDPAGDSGSGDEMDLTELFTAMDDNYLYFQLNTGAKPDSDWESWEVSLTADSSAVNSCGGTKWEISLEAGYPNMIFIDRTAGCNESQNPKAYPAEVTWGETLEAKILLGYLRNPSEFNIINIKGYLIGTNDQVIIADEMRQ